MSFTKIWCFELGFFKLFAMTVHYRYLILLLRLSICYHSCIFHPCCLLPHFPLLHFQRPHAYILHNNFIGDHGTWVKCGPGLQLWSAFYPLTVHASAGPHWFTVVSRKVTFPESRFPEKTFPGQSLSRKDFSRTCQIDVHLLFVSKIYNNFMKTEAIINARIFNQLVSGYDLRV